MAAAKFCRFCLITDVKMDVVNSVDLEYFNTLIEPSSQILACYECIATVGKIKTFLNKYTTSQAVLGAILETQHQVSEKDVKGINRKTLKLESNLKCENPLIISLDTQSEEHLANGASCRKSLKQTPVNLGRTVDGDIEPKCETAIGLPDDVNENKDRCEASYVNSEITNKRRSARSNKTIKTKNETVERNKGTKRKSAEPTETPNSNTEGKKSDCEEAKEEMKMQTIHPNEFSFLEEEITILDDEDDEDDILYLERNVEDVINSLNQATTQQWLTNNRITKSNQKQIKSTDLKVESEGSILERINSHKRKSAKRRDVDRRVLSNDCDEKKIDNSNEFSFLEEEISIFDDEDDDDRERSDILYLDNVSEDGVDSLNHITKPKNLSKNMRKSKSNFTKPRLWEEFLDDRELPNAANSQLVYRCPHCPKTFVNSAILKVHVNEVHIRKIKNSTSIAAKP